MKSFLILSLFVFTTSAFAKVAVECPLKDPKGDSFRVANLYSPTTEKENWLPFTDAAKKTWNVKGKKLQAACFYGTKEGPSYIEDKFAMYTTCKALEQKKGSKMFNLIDCM